MNSNKIGKLTFDEELLNRFEQAIDPAHPERGDIPIKILGYGEISIVFEITGDKYPLAYKRLPIFSSEEQVERHIKAYERYNTLLTNLEIPVPNYDAIWFRTGKKKKKITLYCIQEKINPSTVVNKIIHDNLDQEQFNTLILLLLRKMRKVWDFNRKDTEINIGLDGQISNWALIGYDTSNPQIDEKSELIYFDTSTPMYRTEGGTKEAMEAQLFLKSAPSFLRWLLKALFLQEVLDRYYDWRLVTIDMVANFYKEQKAEMIPKILEITNDFFDSEAADFEIEPITAKEVKSYYKSDKRIWNIFQKARRMDRFLTTKIFRKKYDFYLPGKIKR